MEQYEAIVKHPYIDRQNKHFILLNNAEQELSLIHIFDELSYDEIKEKIIHRTVQYIPDYASIVDKMCIRDRKTSQATTDGRYRNAFRMEPISYRRKRMAMEKTRMEI